jgi:branched-chain amino acid transport system permease protein
MQQILVELGPILLVGISLGSLFGLVGVGFTVIINATQLVNFGQGDFAMLGVAVCWFLMSVLGLPLWLAFPLAVVVGGLFGFATDKVIVSPLIRRGAEPLAPILGTMAMGMIGAGVVGAYTGFYWMPINHFISMTPWTIARVNVDTQGALIIVATVVIVIGYWLLLNKTLMGTALRASGFNREVSTLLGIQTSKMVALSFVISGVISAIAGILCAPLSTFTAHEGLQLALNGFIALIVGGWGNPYAAVLGGVTVGLIRAFLTGYFSSAHAELATFVVLILVLTLKPEGLFPRFMVPKEMKKISG